MNQMKNSGIDWIGEIPEEWEINKIKFTSQLNGRIGWQGLTSNEYQEEGPYLITGTDFDNGGINFETAVHIEESRWKEAKQIQVKNGDLLITKDGTVGKVAIISNLDDKASLNSGVLRIQPIERVDRKFLYYVLLSEEFWLWFNYTNSGASTILHLYQNVFDEFSYALPNFSEQQQIASFLDEKVSKLNEAKRLLNAQIEVLKNYRKSLIWETVTKGLDKTVPMKDYEWIDTKLKYIIGIKSGESVVKEHIDEGEFPVLGGGNKILGFHNQFNVDIQNILIGRVGSAGIVTNVCYKSFATDNALIVFTNFPKKFVYYLLESMNLESLSTSNAQPLITATKVLEQKVLIPKFKFQQEKIANFLDEKTDLIDKIIVNKQSQIDNIEKQKKTLIYDYVTGKRRV